MSDLTQQTGEIYRPRPENNPRDRADRYKRVHFYVSQMGITASDELRKVLVTIKRNSNQFKSPDLQRIAAKQYKEIEFMPATKELMCIWVHLEAIDQGGELMPAWLMNFFKLSLFASDYLLEGPKAMEVMNAHADCRSLDELCVEVALSLSTFLGYGEKARTLAPAFQPLLLGSRPIRQNILRQALTLPISDLEAAIV